MSNVSDFVTGFFTKKSKSTAQSNPVLGAGLRVPYGPFQFQIRIAVGAQYEIQASTDLAHWVTLATNTAVSDTVDYVDSDAPKCGHRFYRVTGEAIHSENILGYVTMTLPPGFAMVANPVKAPDNSVGALLPKMPDGTRFDKFDTGLFKLTKNSVLGGKWTNPGETLVPGEGGIIFNPTREGIVVTFVGEVMHGNLFYPIPAGFSIRSSLLPQAGRLDTDLEFPFSDGDAIHLFDRDKQEYRIYTLGDKSWAANPPIVGVGESFWISKNSPGNWTREFAVGTGPVAGG
ncbi:MAG: hypothetical protein ACYDH9_01550 [Limisphaerales bacterium]